MKTPPAAVGAVSQKEHPLLTVGRGHTFFLQRVLHTKCSPTCLASYGDTAVFSLTAHFTPPIQIYLNHSFHKAYGKGVDLFLL